jgi:hypothetical protein
MVAIGIRYADSWGSCVLKFVGSLDRRIEGFIAYVTTTAVAEGHS